MSFSIQRATSDGTLQEIMLSLVFISRSDISVTVDDVLQVEGVDYTWETDSLISFTVPVPNGLEVVLRRSTDLAQLLNIFSLGAVFNNATMDENFEQLLFVAQEAKEGATLTDLFNDVDMHGSTLLNLGPAVELSSPITLEQFQGFAADSAAVLRVDLQNDTDPAKGAGLSGFDSGLIYPEDTVGRVLTELGEAVAVLTPGIPGADPTGVLDSTAAIQSWVNSNSVITGAPGATYRTTGAITVSQPKIIDLNGATIDAQFTTQVPAFNVQSNLVRIGRGTINVTGTLMGGNGASLNCIFAGNQGTGAGFHSLHFHDLTVSTNRNDAGASIGIIGECHNVLIENIKVPDNANCRNIIGIEWGGTPVGGTGHPHNITVRNIEIGRLTYPTYGSAGYAYAVWISAAFNVRVENVNMVEGYGLVMATRGDNANTYAPAKYKHLVGRGITVDNASIAECFGYGIRAIGSHRSLTLDNIPMSVAFRNIKVKGKKVGANNNFAFAAEQSDGVILDDFEFDGVLAAGIVTGTNNDNLYLGHGKVSGCELYGGSLGNSCRWPVVDHVTFYGNNTLNGAGSGTAALVIGDALHPDLRHNIFGLPGVAETQKYSISCTAATVSPKLNNNHTYAHAAAGAAYVIGGSTDYAINATGQNNTAEAGLTLWVGAPIFTIDNMGFRTFTTSTAVGTVPTTGTWVRGDRLYYGQPSASGYIGAVCVTSGTPGSWRSFGAIVS